MKEQPSGLLFLFASPRASLENKAPFITVEVCVRSAFLLSILTVCALAGAAACDVYRSSDRDDCNSNCAAGAPTPTPSSKHAAVLNGLLSRECKTAKESNAKPAADVEASIASSADEQLVHLVRRSETQTVTCDVAFEPASNLPAARDILIETAILAVSDALNARPSP